VKKEDPAEIKATSTLYEIEVEMSKDNYNVLMAILLNNFSEKGSFESVDKRTCSLTPRSRPTPTWRAACWRTTGGTSRSTDGKKNTSFFAPSQSLLVFHLGFMGADMRRA
jgi:hypothetical protein